MGYFFVILAVVCFAMQFAFTNAYEGRVKQTTATSFVMLAIASALGGILYLIIGGFRVNVSPISLILAAVYAIIMIPYYLISIKVLSLGSLAVYSMFMMLGGMVVPFLFGTIFLKEPVTPWRIVGCVLLTSFIILQAAGQKKSAQTTKKKRVLFILLCLCIFLVNGLTGVIATVHQGQPNAVDEVSFTVLSCAFSVAISLAVLGIILIFRGRKSRLSEMRQATRPLPLLFSLLIGGAMYTGNFLILLAANEVPASVQFPLISGGTIVLSAIVSATVFKEKLSVTEWVAVGGAFASTFLFAF